MGGILVAKDRVRRPLVPTWPQIIQAGLKLVEEPEPQNVRRYVELVRESESSPPYHLQPILQCLEEVSVRTAKDRAGIAVLDHGCGGAATLMYLAAIGYRQVHGVDVGGDTEKTDRALRAITGLNEQRIFLYDGSNLPFSEGKFDFIFSQQVIEHVSDDCIGSYLDDEVRVLCDSGIVYHQIPHRWTPWESHTKTWGIHYLPQLVQSQMYKLLGHDPEYVAKLIYLRSPLYYVRELRARYQTVSNETLERLRLQPDAEYYDGNLKLRQFVSAVALLPVVRLLISNLVMLDVTAQEVSRDISVNRAIQNDSRGE